MKKKRLTYIAIPNSSGTVKKERIKEAKKEINERFVEKVLILKGKDSEEDILYLGKVVKKGDRVGFDTFPLHYKEYKQLIKKAKKQGKFPKGVKIENLEIPQGFKKSIYGFLGLTEEKLKKRKLDFVKNRKDKFWRKLKRFVHKIVRV